MLKHRWRARWLFQLALLSVLVTSSLVLAAERQGSPIAQKGPTTATTPSAVNNITTRTSRYYIIPPSTQSTSSNGTGVSDQGVTSLPGPAVTGDHEALEVPPGTITTRKVQKNVTITKTTTKTTRAAAAEDTKYEDKNDNHGDDEDDNDDDDDNDNDDDDNDDNGGDSEEGDDDDDDDSDNGGESENDDDDDDDDNSDNGGESENDDDNDDNSDNGGDDNDDDDSGDGADDDDDDKDNSHEALEVPPPPGTIKTRKVTRNITITKTTTKTKTTVTARAARAAAAEDTVAEEEEYDDKEGDEADADNAAAADGDDPVTEDEEYDKGYDGLEDHNNAESAAAAAPAEASSPVTATQQTLNRTASPSPAAARTTAAVVATPTNMSAGTVHLSPAAAAAAGQQPGSAGLKPAFGSVTTTPNANATGGRAAVVQAMQGTASTTVPSSSNPVPSKVPGSNPTVPSPKPFILEQAGAKQQILIGCMAAFEGDSSVTGNAVYAGFRMALVDKGRSILPGVNVNLTCVNTKCNDVITHHTADKFVKEKAVAALGATCSVPAAGIAQLRQLPMVVVSSTSPVLTQYNYVFRTALSDRYQGMAVAEMIRSTGGRNVGVVYQDTPFGFGLVFNFIAAFTARGGSVPVIYAYGTPARRQGNATEAVAQMLAGKRNASFPLDSVFLVNNQTFTSHFLRAAQAAKLNLTLYGSDEIADPMVLRLLSDTPSAVANLTMTAPTPGDPAFIAEFKKFSNSTDKDFSTYASRGYDAMIALLQAYKAAAAPRNGSSIRAALQKQQFQGVSGPIAFDSNGDLLPTEDYYVTATFNVTTGGLNFGPPILLNLPKQQPKGRRLLRL